MAWRWWTGLVDAKKLKNFDEKMPKVSHFFFMEYQKEKKNKKENSEKIVEKSQSIDNTKLRFAAALRRYPCT